MGGKIPASNAELFVANSGTTVRFLAAMLALAHGTYRLDGSERMRERPIADLLDALKSLGVDAASERPGGSPPVRIESHGLRGGEVHIRGDVSSQFLSGLLLAAPYAERPLTILVDGELVSQPYIEITLGVMHAFGVEVARDGFKRFSLPGKQKYQAIGYAIEPDASAASYYFAAAAIAGGEATVAGLSRDSLQGDVGFVDVLEEMGCGVGFDSESITVRRPRNVPLRGVTVNMNGISDTVQTLAAVALFAEGPTEITGVGHIRHKETDRIAALATELRKLGATVDERPDGLRIVPGILHGAEIDTYRDHRMAMSLSLVGLKVPGVKIRDPRCVDKTYPEFFADLERVRGTSK
jgi:3-phosphoshikimate 1-carboxyvinyltransferase